MSFLVFSGSPARSASGPMAKGPRGAFGAPWDPPHPKGPKGTQGGKGGPRGPRGGKGTQGDPREGIQGGAKGPKVGPWCPLGVIPKSFGMESHFEWKVISKGKPIPNESHSEGNSQEGKPLRVVKNRPFMHPSLNLAFFKPTLTWLCRQCCLFAYLVCL